MKTQDGFQSIETIQSGDIVASTNEHTGKISYKKVVQTFIRQTPRIYKLTYNDGTSVETTGDHPFFIQGKGWTNADSMTNGDISPTWAGIQKSGGVVEKGIVFSNSEDMISDRVSSLVIKESLAVVDIKVIEEETTVYNFEVEDDHTYFVTEAEVWVHNADEGYILKIDLVGVGGLNAAHSAKNKYLSGKKTKEEKEEYDEEMIAIQSGKYLTTFESLKKTFTNGLNIVKDNILSPIGNGIVSLGSTIGNGILNIGSAIGSGMSYIAQGFTNAIFPHQPEMIPVESVETVEVASTLGEAELKEISGDFVNTKAIIRTKNGMYINVENQEQRALSPDLLAMCRVKIIMKHAPLHRL